MPIDSVLMRRFRAGEAEAFEVVVQCHNKSLIQSLSRILRSDDLADEIAQETFIRLFETRGRYRDEDKMGSYLLAIAMNLVADHRRRERSRHELSQRLEETREPIVESPEEVALTGERGSQLLAAIYMLTPKLRTTALLHYVYGCSIQSISLSTGSSVSNVRTRLCRAHELMRGHLTSLWKGDNHDQRPERRGDHQRSEEPAVP